MRVVWALLLSLLFSVPVFAQEPTIAAPRGEVNHYIFDHSRIFPGTTRDYWVYVPRQYDPAKPACVYVNQDGLQWNAPEVFDQLIAAGQMPVTIGVFVMHGRVRSPSPASLDRFNRSLEYDGLGPAYANFLLDELLPEVETRTASDGRPIHLSHNGNDRCIGGSSSGAIAAFTAAWERPDSFTRVFSAIGTYVGLRGGNNYPTLIRKYEPRPIRVFLQDGSSDLNIYGGDWWMANQEMERALQFAGYEVNHVWGTGGHSGQQGTEVFPDAMRWLWKDWPIPVKAGSGSSQLREILIPGEEWQSVGTAASGTPLLASVQGGVLGSTAGGTAQIISSNGQSTARKVPARAAAVAWTPDGSLIASVGRNLISMDAAGHQRIIAAGIRGQGIVVGHYGGAFVTEPGRSRIWHLSRAGKRAVVDEGIKMPTGITLSPDQSLLYVADGASHWVYSFQVQPDGALNYKQRFYHLHTPDTRDDSGARGMCVDRDGRLYVATALGIQVCDQAGRVNCILPLPEGEGTSVAFGGPDGSTLYAASGEHIYRRSTKAHGAFSYQEPNRPAPPNL